MPVVPTQALYEIVVVRLHLRLGLVLGSKAVRGSFLLPSLFFKTCIELGRVVLVKRVGGSLLINELLEVVDSFAEALGEQLELLVSFFKLLVLPLQLISVLPLCI